MALAGMMGGRGGSGAPAAAGGGGYGSIGGPLPFSGGGEDYASAYAAALNFNQANYNQILQGYQQTAASQQAQQQAIIGGYNNLKSSVLGGLAGIDRSQRQAIADEYSANIGRGSQQLISRGLGNSTIQQSVARGFLYDKAKADIDLTNRTQALNAQYESQLGLAGLGYQGDALNQNTRLAQDQLHWMNSINASYPDARGYMDVERMRGASSGGGGSAGGGFAAPPGRGFSGVSGPSSPSYGGGAGYGNRYGAAPVTLDRLYGGSQTLYPSAGNEYDMHSFEGMWDYAENAQDDSAGFGPASDGWTYASADGGTPGSDDGWLYEGYDY